MSAVLCTIASMPLGLETLVVRLSVSKTGAIGGMTIRQTCPLDFPPEKEQDR